MEIIRAALSVCCFLLAFDYLEEKKWIKYYMFAVIAIGFHTEAIVLLIFPILQNLLNIKPGFRTIVGCLVVSFGVLQIANFIPVVNTIFSYMDFDGGFYSNIRQPNANAYLLTIFSILPAIGILLLNNNNNEFKFSWLLLCYIFCSIQTLKYTVFFGRILDFMHPIMIVSIVQTIETHNKNMDKFIINLCVSIFVLTCLHTYIKNSYYPDWKKYYPYSSVINPDENIEREWYITDMIINR